MGEGVFGNKLQKAPRFAGDCACPGFLVVVAYDHGFPEFCQNNPHGTSILNEVVAGVRN